MYDNSSLTKYYSSIAQLYLYDNATATFFDETVSDIYISSASTGWVKLYAYDVTFAPFGLNGEGKLKGRWLANDMPLSMDLFGEGAYSHIQIVPEPMTFALFGLGGLTIFRRCRR